jgi:hypothetical protein
MSLMEDGCAHGVPLSGAMGTLNARRVRPVNGWPGVPRQVARLEVPWQRFGAYRSYHASLPPV